MEIHRANLTGTHFSCPSCQASYRFQVKVLPFFCSCGARLDEITYTNRAPELVVIKPKALGVGDVLTGIMKELGVQEKENCSCKSTAAKMNQWGVEGCEQNREWIVQQLEANSAKYSWFEKIQIAISNAVNPLALSLAFRGNVYHALLDEAIARAKRLPEDQATAESFTPNYLAGDVGVLSAVFNRIGGTETYWQSMHDRIGITGISIPKEPQWKQAGFPVGWGLNSIEALASNVKSLIVWGVTDMDERTRGPRRIAIHHGSLASTWANSVFENQLRWCEDAVAINREVADHYGVKYIGNAIDPSRIEGQAYPKKKKVVLWLHREAQEKRPQLVRKIAQRLPSDWEMVASLPPERETENLRCIGQVDHPGRWLATADVFLSTASQEGFGYSIAEAMAAGVPVVSSPFGIAADPQLIEQVDTELISDWVDAILRAGPKADRAKRYIDENHGIDAWVAAWRNLLSL